MLLVLIPLNATAEENNWIDALKPENVIKPEHDKNKAYRVYRRACGVLKEHWEKADTFETAIEEVEGLLAPLDAQFSYQSPIEIGYYSYYFKDGSFPDLVRDTKLLQSYLSTLPNSGEQITPSMKQKGVFAAYPDLHASYHETKDQFGLTTLDLKTHYEEPYLRIDVKSEQWLDEGNPFANEPPEYLTEAVNRFFETAVRQGDSKPFDTKPWTFSHVKKLAEFNVAYVIPIPDKYHQNIGVERVALSMTFVGEPVDGSLNDIEMLKSYCTITNMEASERLSRPVLPPKSKGCRQWNLWWDCVQMDAMSKEKGANICRRAPAAEPECRE